MARITWKDMKAEALLDLRNRSDISSRIERWLREAYLETAYGYRFYELEKTKEFTLSVDASEITFATIGITDLKHILSLRDQTNERKIDPSSFRAIDDLSIGSGTPSHYCRFGSSLLFDAKPASTGISYKLRYRKQISEPDFTSSTATPETPDEWDEIIRLLAVQRGFAALFEWDMSDRTEARVGRLIGKTPTDEFVEAEDQDFGLTPRM